MNKKKVLGKIRKTIQLQLQEVEMVGFEDNLFKNNPKKYKKTINVPESLDKIKIVFSQNNKQLFLVGGAVRDSLLGKSPKDYDLASEATPDEVISMLRNQPFVKNILETGKKFGIVNVITDDGEEYEIARFRTDVGKGRRPDSIKFASIDQDVLRRDLTINALFYDLNKKEIIDYVGGVEDIKNGVVRTVGDPTERFEEDALRKIRAIRFAARLGSKLDPKTAKSLKDDNSLDGVSEERIRDEFLKGIKTAKQVKYFLELLEKYNFFPAIFNTKVNVDNFIEERNPIVLIANLLKNKKPEDINSFLTNAKYTNKEISSIVFLVALLKLGTKTAPFLKKMYKKTKLDLNVIMTFAKINDIDMDKIEALQKLIQFKVSGNDLKAQGFDGEDVGEEINRQETEYFKSLL